MKIDNFFYPVDNIQESLVFYKDILELPIKFDFRERGMIAFKIGQEEAAIIVKEKSKFPESKACVWIEVENVNVMYETLLIKNVRFLSEPYKIHTGFAVEFYDPSGNIIGITDYNL